MKVHKVTFNDPHPELIGKKFGQRTVLAFVGVNNGAIAVYQTQCECGKKFKESYDDLFKKKRQRCGTCLKADTGTSLGAAPYGLVDPDTFLNPQQEAFCQEYVRHWDATVAASRSGYSETSGPGLLANKNVRVRIEVLIKQQRRKMEKMREESARECKIDLNRVTQMLLRDREAALTGRVHLEGREPEPPHEKWRPDNRAAVQATMGIAQLHGLLIKRTEVTVIDVMEQMNDYELIDFVQKLKDKLADTITIDVSPLSRLVEHQDEQEDTDAEE
jgi:phage terminase small subunit